MTVQELMQVDEISGVTVIRILSEELLEQHVIEELGRELLALSEGGDRSRFLLNLKDVQYFSSAVIGKFVALNNRACRAGGAVRICCAEPHIREMFHICRLDRVFDFADTEAQGVRMF